MNSKSSNFKGNSHNAPLQGGKTSNDVSLPPKTPLKRHHPQPQSSFYANLSPFNFPPRNEARSNDFNFVPFLQMQQVQTPIPRERPKLIVDAEGIDYGIIHKIIFESAREDPEINSSSLESSSDPDENSSENSHSDDSEEKSCSDSEEERSSLQEERHIKANGGDGDSKGRRSTNHRGTINQNSESTPGKKVMCNCKKTKCLKLYCDCFRLNQTCDGCNCVGCHNLDIYEEERNNAIMALMDRNPDPFGQKIEDDKHVKGCNCKKSNCLKKYCECYQAGLKCGENCKCEECKNIVLQKGNSDGDKPLNKNTAKKERRMLQM